MRIKPLTEKQIKWITIPLVVPFVIAALPVLICIAIFSVILSPFEKIYENYRDKQIAKDWHTWYAWHPVFVEGFWYNRSDVWVWREHIERKRLRYVWKKRLPGEELEYEKDVYNSSSD